MVKDTDGSTVWSDGPQNKYDRHPPGQKVAKDQSMGCLVQHDTLRYFSGHCSNTFEFDEISKIGKETQQAGKLGKKLEWKISYVLF